MARPAHSPRKGLRNVGNWSRFLRRNILRAGPTRAGELSSKQAEIYNRTALSTALQLTGLHRSISRGTRVRLAECLLDWRLRGNEVKRQMNTELRVAEVRYGLPIPDDILRNIEGMLREERVRDVLPLEIEIHGICRGNENRQKLLHELTELDRIAHEIV